MIPYFVSKKPVQITHIAACKQRSVAVSNETLEVFEWGYLYDAREESQSESQFRSTCKLPGPVKQIEIGLEFNLFLLEDGSVWFQGQITHGAQTIVTSAGEKSGLLNLSSMLKSNMATEAKFTHIACGFSHALFLDDQGLIYTFGAG